MTTLQLVAELAPAAACMRDAATGSHLELVNRITRLIATGVAPHEGLSDRLVEQVSTFARLLKPGRLDAAEMAVMRTHVEKGLVILERLDSTGYPAGLRGEAIPLEGRVVAVADVFDALTHTRPYRQSLSLDEGLAIVRQQADAGQLDPLCVAALEAQRPALERIVAEFRDRP